MKKTVISLIMMVMALCLSSCQKEETPIFEGEWDVYHLISRIVEADGEVSSYNELQLGFITEMSFVFEKTGCATFDAKTCSPLTGEIKVHEMEFVYKIDGNKMRIEEGGNAHNAEFKLDNDTLMIDLEGSTLFRAFWGIDCDFTIRMTKK